MTILLRVIFVICTLAFVGCQSQPSTQSQQMAINDSVTGICLDGPGRPCTPVRSLEEAVELAAKRATENRERAENLDVDYEDVAVAALSGLLPSPPYCLFVFGEPPSLRLRERLVARGHVLLECDVKGPSVSIDVLEQISPGHYRVHITSHCGDGGMCSSAFWHYIERQGKSLILQRSELDWIT